MSTVARRTFRSSPYRDAAQTWSAVSDLLARSDTESVRAELRGVSGIAASLIADQAPKNAPIVVTCDGPRTRIYCAYEDDAIDGGDANEAPLGYDALAGVWRISFPCHGDDLAWVQASLKKLSDRITARDIDDGVYADSESGSSGTLTIDPKGFLEP